LWQTQRQPVFKKTNNKVLGVDISPTAIEKAKASYPDKSLRTMGVMQVASNW
jgi:hypothetical protein